MSARKATRPAVFLDYEPCAVSDLSAGIDREANLNHLKFQALFLATRYAMTMPHAAIVAGLVFCEVRP